MSDRQIRVSNFAPRHISVAKGAQSGRVSERPVVLIRHICTSDESSHPFSLLAVTLLVFPRA